MYSFSKARRKYTDSPSKYVTCIEVFLLLQIKHCGFIKQWTRDEA